MHILIDDFALDIVEELNKKYKELLQKEVDYSVVDSEKIGIMSQINDWRKSKFTNGI